MSPPARNPQQLLSQAVALHNAGRAAEAEAFYWQILALEPGHFMGRHLLGVLRYQQGRPAEALALIGEALKAEPASSEALANYGLVLAALGRLDEALVSYDKSLAARPDNVEALNNRGNAFLDLKRFAEALDSYDRALAINPHLAGTLDNRGNALRMLKRFEEALASYDRALAITPGLAQTLNNRGNALWDMARFEEALASYGHALAARPGFAQAAYNCANVLKLFGRGAEALAHYERAIALKPDYAEALINRGNVLHDLKRHEDALASYDRALGVQPRNPQTLVNRGNVLADLGRLEDALASYDKALSIDPANVVGLNNRGNMLRALKRLPEALASYDRAVAVQPDLAQAYYNRSGLLWVESQIYDAAVSDMEKVIAIDPDYEYARGDLLHLRMYGADWQGFDDQVAGINAGVRAGARVVHPFVYQAVSTSPADLQACSVLYAAHRYPAVLPAMAKPGPRPGRIRVGYLCGEFREQATSLLSAGLYECHDRSRFEIVALDSGAGDGSALRRRLEAAFDKFIYIGALSGRHAAGRIAAEEIDILVNLNGYFGAQRMDIFAHRPAPLQVNYLGFPATLGASYIDYILADRFVIPPDEQEFYTEKVVYLPHSYQINDSRRQAADIVATRADNGLPETGFVFCNFNQSYKFTPALFAVWMRILAQVDGSVLWLMENNDRFPENLRREAQKHGVAAERLIFAPHRRADQHLARLGLADLLLDSLPYNAHTTASDALFSNVPVLTCPGTSFAGRVGQSLLHAIGLPELVASSMEDYESLAVALARDEARLAAVRAKLARNRDTHPLYDTPRFTRQLERAYEIMWEGFQQGRAPAGFQVDALE